MAFDNYYVDHSLHAGSPDSGTGTIGDPYSSLGYAFATETIDAFADGWRWNVKGTTALDPMTDLGTLPTGSSISRQLIIQSYDTVVGDSSALVYLEDNGTQEWTNVALDGIFFNGCHFSVSGGTGNDVFADLDNNITFQCCEFDGCSVTGDSNNTAISCRFYNMTPGAGVTLLSASVAMYFCNVSGSGGYAGNIFSVSQACGNSIYWDGDINAMMVCQSNGGGVISNNSFMYGTKPTTTTGACIRADDNTLIFGNYMENARNAIQIEGNADTPMVMDNAYFGNNTNINGSGYEDTETCTTYTQTVLTAAGLTDPANDDWTPTTELAELRTSGVGTGATPTTHPMSYGAFLSPNTGTGGGGYTYKPTLRIIN